MRDATVPCVCVCVVYDNASGRSAEHRVRARVWRGPRPTATHGGDCRIGVFRAVLLILWAMAPRGEGEGAQNNNF